MLGLVADIESHGGGTLLVRRSHHLVRKLASTSAGGDAGSSSQVREKLDRSGTDFCDNVYEFVGKEGDVVLFDPWLFHSASKNVRSSPRLMIEQNLPSRKALKLYAPS